MIFSSTIFIFYFLPLFFLVYFLVPHNWKNFVILVGSILFYSWGAPRFIFVILATTTVDFYLVKAMAAQHRELYRRLFLVLSAGLNLGLLVYFKYSNFFVENINTVLAQFHLQPIPWLKVVLPIGISFYTFESLTYVVDVYRRVHEPLKRFWDYQLYIIFFPKLIAGPIVRYHDIADQIYDRSRQSGLPYRLSGFYRFCIGLGKKVLIANVMATCADNIFALPVADISTATAWIGAIAYTFQIYFDFSGYSDMAIGLALMMGFKLPENFNNPYSSFSITEFWRRWHITLGSWMRNYLYIPLGGNKVSKVRLYLNLWIVFLASGLWHGAAWGFIFWGVYHGFFLVIERMFLGRFLQRLGRFSVIYTMLAVTIGWVFFRLEAWGPSVAYVRRMFAFDGGEIVLQRNEFVMMLIAGFFSWFLLLPYGEKLQQRFYGLPGSTAGFYRLGFTMMVLLVMSAGSLVSSGFNPFIYFRF